MKRTIALALTLVVALTFGLAGCSATGSKTPSAGEPTVKEGPVVRVGSFLDSEGAVLGAMMIQLLDANGIQTEDKTKLGTPDVLRKALLEGQIDLSIDYTGSGQYYHEGQEGDPVWSSAADGYARIAELDKAVGLTWLTPANANNTELLATTKKLAEAEGLKTMDDFAAYVNAGKTVKIIGAQEWIDSELGLAGFEKAYGFKLTEDQLIGLSHGVTAEMLSALANGTDGVNFSLAYGTDGQLDDLGLVILEDTKGVPPVYEPAPVIRTETLDAYPEIADILKPLFESFDLATLQDLNRRVALGGEDAKAVAEEYLTQNGFLK
ncbi:MAG: glycine betaine ABC transporter substrate-binding protein [Coriobacteriia bacterium]